MRELLPVIALLLEGCGAQPATGVTFDPCASTAIVAGVATADELASIDDGIAMWQTRGAGLVRGDAAEIAIEFRDAGDAVHGFYDDTTATVYVNSRITDRAQRAITIAHELGHALGMIHVAPDVRVSVMNPGNLTVEPNPDDATSLFVQWGSCADR